jgi:peptide/nickel transport system ATP-binding protein
MTREFIIEGRNLHKQFWVKRGHGPVARRVSFLAVDDVSIGLEAGTVTGLVGESGSGKTTVVRMLARIIAPDSGEVLLDGRPAPSGRPRGYARQVQMVFQDPFASLNPVYRVRHHLLRPLRIHHLAGADAGPAIADLLRRVALEPPDQFADKFPHELSGGQRQRVSIARALAVRPRVLLADEPVSMLDVSIRLGVLNLLRDLVGGEAPPQPAAGMNPTSRRPPPLLRDRERLAILYVTHDIASARYLADTITVMYAGQVVESAPSATLTDSPAHPYTQLLLSAAPDPDRDVPPKLASREASSSPPRISNACPFHPRCPHVMDVCRREKPPAVQVSPGHAAACWLHVGPSQQQHEKEEIRLDESTAPNADPRQAAALPSGGPQIKEDVS